MTLSKYINQLENFNINHIGYREFYDDGTSMAFCSKLEWYVVAPYVEGMNIDMSIHYALELLKLNKDGFDYIVRSISSINNKFLEQLSLQDMCNSLLIYKREGKVIKMFSFIASKSNKTALNYFFNNREKFEEMIKLYENDLAIIFKKVEYQKLRQPLFNQNVVNSIFKNSSTQSKNKNILTPREEECVKLLIEEARDKDIANFLGISPRTASQHIANIKKKLQVSNRFIVKKVDIGDIK